MGGRFTTTLTGSVSSHPSLSRIGILASLENSVKKLYTADTILSYSWIIIELKHKERESPYDHQSLQT
jgi:hypothetical protein